MVELGTMCRWSHTTIKELLLLFGDVDGESTLWLLCWCHQLMLFLVLLSNRMPLRHGQGCIVVIWQVAGALFGGEGDIVGFVM